MTVDYNISHGARRSEVLCSVSLGNFQGKFLKATYCVFTVNWSFIGYLLCQHLLICFWFCRNTESLHWLHGKGNEKKRDSTAEQAAHGLVCNFRIHFEIILRTQYIFLYVFWLIHMHSVYFLIMGPVLHPLILLNACQVMMLREIDADLKIDFPGEALYLPAKRQQDTGKQP